MTGRDFSHLYDEFLPKNEPPAEQVTLPEKTAPNYVLKRYYMPKEIDTMLATIRQENKFLENNSAAMRFLVFEQYKDYEHQKRKVASMSNELSITLELVASLAKQVKTTVLDREEVEEYHEAKGLVDRRIKTRMSRRKYH